MIVDPPLNSFEFLDKLRRAKKLIQNATVDENTAKQLGDQIVKQFGVEVLKAILDEQKKALDYGSPPNRKQRRLMKKRKK